MERERGITVKAQTASLIHTHSEKLYLLNLIDTPVSWHIHWLACLYNLLVGLCVWGGGRWEVCMCVSVGVCIHTCVWDEGGRILSLECVQLVSFVLVVGVYAYV